MDEITYTFHFVPGSDDAMDVIDAREDGGTVASLRITHTGRLHSVEVRPEHRGRRLPEQLLAVAREALEEPLRLGDVVSDDVREWVAAAAEMDAPTWWTDAEEGDDTWQKFVSMPGDMVTLEEAYKSLAAGDEYMDDDERLELLAFYTTQLNKDGRAIPQLNEPIMVRVDGQQVSLAEAYTLIEDGAVLDGVQSPSQEQRTIVLSHISTILAEQNIEG